MTRAERQAAAKELKVLSAIYDNMTLLSEDEITVTFCVRTNAEGAGVLMGTLLDNRIRELSKKLGKKARG